MSEYLDTKPFNIGIEMCDRAINSAGMLQTKAEHPMPHNKREIETETESISNLYTAFIVQYTNSISNCIEHNFQFLAYA